VPGEKYRFRNPGRGRDRLQARPLWATAHNEKPGAEPFWHGGEGTDQATEILLRPQRRDGADD
jgi:hypothetical protein